VDDDDPTTDARAFLARLVAEGRAIPPTATGPIPYPAECGDPTINIADELSAARAEERW
jgi:hypothetical protein